MANPIDALLDYQRLFNSGTPPELSDLDAGYLKLSGEVKSGKRYDYIKIIGREVQALAIFGYEEQMQDNREIEFP